MQWAADSWKALLSIQDSSNQWRFHSDLPIRALTTKLCAHTARRLLCVNRRNSQKYTRFIEFLVKHWTLALDGNIALIKQSSRARRLDNWMVHTTSGCDILYKVKDDWNCQQWRGFSFTASTLSIQNHNVASSVHVGSTLSMCCCSCNRVVLLKRHRWSYSFWVSKAFWISVRLGALQQFCGSCIALTLNGIHRKMHHKMSMATSRFKMFSLALAMTRSDRWLCRFSFLLLMHWRFR